MSDQNEQLNDQLNDQLESVYPAPDRFGWLRLWRRESATSLGVSVIAFMVIAVLLLAGRLQWPTEDPEVPTIEITAITLSSAERAEIDLGEPLVRTESSSMADVRTNTTSRPDTPSVTAVAAGKEDLRTAPGLEADTTAIDNAVDQALGDLEDARTGLKQARKKSATRRKAVAVARANGGDEPITDAAIRKLLDGRKSLERRQKLVRRDGGSRQTEAAVDLGLQWLATHQSTDGRWSLDAFHQRHQCGQQCTHQGSVHSDTGATALALLPFLARGETHRSGSYKKVVSAGLRWLVADQDGNGAFHSIADGKMYSHGLATIALCEAWALTEDRQLRGPAQRAIDYVIAAQSGSGGWRYFPRVDADTSVLGWQMIALVSARAGGLLLNPNPMAGASRYLDSAQVDKAGSQYSYTPRGGASLAMTAEGLLCRQFLGRKRAHHGLVNGVNHLLAHLPRRDAVNFYYWYYGTQVMCHFGGQPWEKWNQEMVQTLLSLQIKNGHAQGSWSPGGGHDTAGGRVYSTALALCVLEVYYRHIRVFE